MTGRQAILIIVALGLGFVLGVLGSAYMPGPVRLLDRENERLEKLNIGLNEKVKTLEKLSKSLQSELDELHAVLDASN